MVQQDKNICQIINFVCSYDGRVDSKELEKKRHLEGELRKMWNIKAKVITLVTGVLGTTPIKLRSWLK